MPNVTHTDKYILTIFALLIRLEINDCGYVLFRSFEISFKAATILLVNNESVVTLYIIAIKFFSSTISLTLFVFQCFLISLYSPNQPGPLSKYRFDF